MKLIKIIIAIILIYKICDVVFDIFYYDEIIEIEKSQLPKSYFDKIKRTDNYHDSMFFKYNLTYLSFDENYYKNFVIKNFRGNYYSADDRIDVYIYNDSTLLVGSGPNTMDSGTRFFFSTPSTKMDLLRLSDFKILHTYNINRIVESAMIVNDTCFFSYYKFRVPTYYAYYIIKRKND